MAAVTPINTSADNFSTPAGPKTATTESGGAGHLEHCFFRCGLTGTYVQGTGYSITSAQIAAAIAAAKRDGQTITIWDVAAVAPGLEGTGNVFTMPGQVTFTSTSGPVTGLLYGVDLATEHAAAAMGTFGSPVTFSVTFSAQANL